MGRAAWPALIGEVSDFERYASQHLAREADLELALERLHAADLFLAYRCTLGDPAAGAALDVKLGRVVRGLRCLAPDAALHEDELRQLVLERLLIPRAGVARIALYSGATSLEEWLRAVAARIALDEQRAAERRLKTNALARGALPVLATALSPELATLRTHDQALVTRALERALALQSAERRAVLRLYFAEGLTLARIARMFQVHHSTISRTLTRATQELLQATREDLGRSLRLTPRSLDSLLRVLRSDLELSLRGL